MVSAEGLFQFFNPAKFDEQTLGIDDVKREVKAVFLEKTPAIVKELVEAAHRKDAVEVEKILHKLKASVSILCFTSFREEVIFLETNASDLLSEDYARRFTNMIDNLKILLSEFDSFPVD